MPLLNHYLCTFNYFDYTFYFLSRFRVGNRVGKVYLFSKEDRSESYFGWKCDQKLKVQG